jgi:O-antigen/teichoic acid export membrane protein
VFDFSSYLANVIQVPQRSLISISIPVLSRAWKDKDMATIDRVYKRSSLNLLLVSIFIFTLIWINYDNAVAALGLNAIYEEGKWVVFLLALKNIIDMGSGVNAQIIGTSTHWRFDFFSGIILLLLAVPLNIILVREYGIIGSAVSNFTAYFIYNTIRIVFLKRKFNLLPFTQKTAWVILHGAACFMAIHFLFQGMSGFTGILTRSVAFVALYGSTAIWLQLSPDINPVMETVKARLRFGRNKS